MILRKDVFGHIELIPYLIHFSFLVVLNNENNIEL